MADRFLRVLATVSILLPALFMIASPTAAENYSPPTRDGFPNRVFWGDTHVHSNLSPDAFSFGNQGVTPEQAYRFARGEVVTAQSGIDAQLARPLDFLMVADHAEFLGVFPLVFDRAPEIADTALGRRWLAYMQEGRIDRVLSEFALVSMNVFESDDKETMLAGFGQTTEFLDGLRDVQVPETLKQSIWERVGSVADQFYEPRRFTTFIGYEWTSFPDGNNLHRNVLFRDGTATTSRVVPFSSIDSPDPEKLWDYMAGYEANTGGSVLAIPHNGNASNGLMFAETTLDGQPLTRDYAERRRRWEPIAEVTQIKGDGESHPFLSPNDEFADYENWDSTNLALTAPKEDWMLEFEYARSALKNGLALDESLGANPFEFGMIGSTDSHTSLATADEDNFFGKMASAEPKAGRAHRPFSELQDETHAPTKQWHAVASGYAAVWAPENTREALFDAMRRRETYATTGPRMPVRFFGGWNFEAGDDLRSDFAQHGYATGVPMGSRLAARNGNSAPRFMVSAMKDPIGANLDRIQIIKGWVDDHGQTHEMVYNVAASNGRNIRRNSVEPIGNTVDVETATYRNSIGDAALSVVWEDPDFNPNQRAFYYVRVLEIPTPRWTTYDAVFFEDEPPEDAPAYGQERAYTSPIWYDPSTQ